jgi:hypothetical protein
MALDALSPQQPKNHKALAQEIKLSKGNHPICSLISDSSNYSSHFITSHSIPQNLEARNITFGDMHLEGFNK